MIRINKDTSVCMGCGRSDSIERSSIIISHDEKSENVVLCNACLMELSMELENHIKIEALKGLKGKGEDYDKTLDQIIKEENDKI